MWPGTHLCHFSKSKFNLYEAESDRVNHVAPASPVHRARYIQTGTGKVLPGSEIQTYDDCPWGGIFYCESVETSSIINNNQEYQDYF